MRGEHKDSQFAALKAINTTGPFDSSLSILSFDEALADARNDTFPFDFSKEDAEQADIEGKLKIYSTEPIENGVNVYTSKEEAKANGKKIYEKVVSTLDVAWDSIEGGIYAQVDSNGRNFILESLLDMSYNDYEKERDKWEAKNKVSKGTRQIMYNPKNGNFEIWEKGDDALLKLIETPDLKEIYKYERDDNEREQELYGSFGWPRNSEGQTPVDSSVYSGQRNDGNGNIGTQETEGETNSIRSRTTNFGRDNGKTLQEINAERSIGNDGALSDAQNSEMRGLEDDYLSSGYFLSDKEQAEMNELLDAMKEAEQTGLLDKPFSYEGKPVERKALRSDVLKAARKIRNELELNRNGTKYTQADTEKLADALNEVYPYMLNDKDYTWDDIVDRAAKVIEPFLKETTFIHHYPDIIQAPSKPI